MEEAIKFEVEDKDGNAMMAELVLNDTKEVVELRMRGNKKVMTVDWEELRKVFKRALVLWDTIVKTE